MGAWVSAPLGRGLRVDAGLPPALILPAVIVAIAVGALVLAVVVAWEVARFATRLVLWAARRVWLSCRRIGEP